MTLKLMITTKTESMKKIKFYPRRKHSNVYTHQLIAYNADHNHVCVMELFKYHPECIIMFPADVFAKVIRDAKLVYMQGGHDLNLQQVTELALREYFANKMTSTFFRTLIGNHADYIFKNPIP